MIQQNTAYSTMCMIIVTIITDVLEYSVQNNNYVILGEIKFEARLYIYRQY